MPSGPALSKEKDGTALEARAPVSRERIVSLAVGIAEREGLGALTINRLCQELQVKPPTIYYHLPNKQALLEMVADAVIGQIELPEVGSGDWRDRIYRLMDDTHVTLARCPDIAAVLVRDAPSRRSLRMSDYVLQTLLEAGFAPGAAVDAFSLLTHYQMGRLLTLAQLSHPRVKRVALRAFLPVQARSAARYPAIAQVHPLLATMDEADEFRAGLRHLLASLAPTGTPA